MIRKTHNDELRAIDDAKRKLQPFPIPWYEFELAAAEVAKKNPEAKGKQRLALIMNIAFQHWSVGTG